jgi:hypothetical protein
VAKIELGLREMSQFKVAVEPDFISWHLTLKVPHGAGAIAPEHRDAAATVADAELQPVFAHCPCKS